MPLYVEKLAAYVQQFGRFQRNARLYLMSNALSGISVGIIAVLYNLYLVSLGYGTAFIGILLFVGTIGGGIAIFPAGVCFDRFGGKAILIWSSVLIGIAGAGQMLFHQPVPLLVSVFLVGIAGAFILVTNAPFLTANSTPAERTHLFSVNIVISLVTTVVGEIIGGALPVWFRGEAWLMTGLPSWVGWVLVPQAGPRGYQMALVFAGLISLPSFVPLFLMSDDRRKRENESSQQNRSRPGFVVNFHSLSFRKIVFSALFGMAVVQGLIGMGAGLFIPYFNVYFVQHLGASSALFGVIDGGANTLNALLTLGAPWLALRMGKVNTIVWTRLVSIPLMLVIGLTGSLWLAASLYPLRQGMMDMSLGILQVFSMEVVGEQHRGLANSSYQAVYQVMWALAAPVGGFVIGRLGYGPVFVVASVLYFLAVVTFWGRFGRVKEV